MPVLVNRATGLAENLPDEDAHIAASTGSHEVPLVDPQGGNVLAPAKEVPALLQQGYKQPDESVLQSLLEHAKYNAPEEQTKAYLEGVGTGGTLGFSTLAQRALGENPEEIRLRREYNPGAHTAGEITGLVGGYMIPGLNGAKVLNAAGHAAETAFGLAKATSFAGRVGSAAVRGAAETALMSGGDELSKMFTSDPNQSAETAIANIGLNGLLGGVIQAPFGAVSPLWKATSESTMGKFLSAVKDRANGVEKNALPMTLDAAIEKSGLNVSPEVKAAISGDPEATRIFQTLQSSTSSSGKKAVNLMSDFRDEIQNSLLNGVGKTADQVESLTEFSDHDAGEFLKKTLKDELKAKVSPIADQFDKYREEFAGAKLGEARQNKLSESIGNLINDERYNIFSETPQAKLAYRFLEAVPKLESMADLNKAVSLIGDATKANPEMYRVGGQLRKLFQEAEDGMTSDLLGERAPELIGQHAEMRAAYKGFRETISDLNDRLHVGKYAGPSSFMKALDEAGAEDVLRRLTPKNDAAIIKTLQEQFPQTAEAVRENYLAKLLRASTKKLAPNEVVNPKALFRTLDGWPPELKNFVLNKGQQEQLGAFRELLHAIPPPGNPSGTAKTLDALWARVPGGATAMVSLLTGHSPISGYIVGELGRLALREIPDAVKLATLKFLGDPNPINASGFKASVDMAAAVISGEKLINKAVKGLFKGAGDVLPQSLHPEAKERNALKKKLDEYSHNPDGLLKVGGDTGYYMPDHATGLSAAAARSVSFLLSQRPNKAPLGPLEKERVPSKDEEAHFDNMLDVAQQPLSVLEKIKQGTLSPADVKTIRHLYPNLYQKLSEKLMNEVITSTSKNETIPYKVKMSLSLFLDTPIDSTMTPFAINSIQKSLTPPVPPMLPGKMPKQIHIPASFSKIPQLSQTPGQASAFRRSTR